MKLIGFIKEHNNIKESQDFTNFKEISSVHQSLDKNVIDYLNNGVLVFGWMGYFTDLDDNTLIAPDSYYTDGFYIWPAYFSYYLKKYSNCSLDKEFLSHLIKCNYVIEKKNINSNLLNEFEIELLKKMG